ncbi:MAG: OB-fold domain-containing protein [Alphaproteobacteria bacterium]|jgi:hypothetical protein|nr:hypothetical protein [Rhodospirillaceae bacterium]MDP6024153.1 OB-fold domain-containing protein [Alphaproteobacteria bacterium]MDP6257233.1 OB-fold domain-containing protein [Alphaproteobacteria bacterium]MDP7056160.1 OB-fold domain-containing protein [Alphaproteobacteria bacterium]MDP7231087.1 OB-fold domain-containing protein [Alphaproteobacteria bacterium]|tara:strand:- start:5252 stop:5776 length:525 start_codon:yes stop_codon:yes gene_type:complete
MSETIVAEYLGMTLQVDNLDHSNLAFFKHCAEHDFHLQKCNDCGLIRYPVGEGCAWCGSGNFTWTPVEGRGAVHSYTEVAHAIQPAFKPYVPYHVLVVDLDTQKGAPTEHEALRVIGNLVTHDGTLAPPDMVASIGIGSRMRMVFTDIADGIAMPQWTIDEEAKQPAKPWRYPE